MAKRPQTTATKQNKPARPAISFETAKLLCPNASVAEKIAQGFVLALPDYDRIRETHETLLRKTWISFDEALNETAAQMHFQRIVGSYVSSAQSAGNFYSRKVTEARDLSSKLANDFRDEDRDAPAGFDNRAERARDFAADMAMQAYALLAAAEGAINAYKEITGEDWKPYAAQSNAPASGAHRSAAAELAAFG